MVGIGDRIKKARIEAGMSQPELAERLGKCTRTVVRYETGITEPSVSMLEKIAALLDVSLGYLLGISKPLAHVKLVEYVHEQGPYSTEEVALFNINKISHRDAMWCVEAGEYNDNVLCMTKRQWVSLFRDGKE